MRKRKGASPVGKPPTAHVRNGLREINFDVRGNTSIIGPRKFPRSRFFNRPVPRIHEFGGQYIFSGYRRTAVMRYPERSYMWNAVKSLNAKNKIQSKFNITLARML